MPTILAHVCLAETSMRLERGDARTAERLARDAFAHAKAAGARGYELLALATRAEALARIGQLDEALRLARQVSAAVDGRRDVERAERVHLRIATALALAEEHELSAAALSDARAVVDSRLEQIRSPELRRRYLESKLVQSIRDGG